MLKIKIMLAAILFAAVGSQASAELRCAGIAERLGWESGDSAVVIPANVRKLPDFAFAGVEGLRRVEFPADSRCEIIGDFAFAECPDLEEVILPPTMVKLGEGIFRNCRNLKKINIPQRMWAIPKECFNGCESLEEIDLSPITLELGAFSFCGCTSLRGITFPGELKRVGNNAFSRCIKLEEVELPESVTLLDSYAFSDCISLRRVVLPANRERLGELIFSGCESLQEIVEGADVPPSFECGSYLFDPGDAAYERCRLLVDCKSQKSYGLHHCWKDFKRIECF